MGKQTKPTLTVTPDHNMLISTDGRYYNAVPPWEKGSCEGCAFKGKVLCDRPQIEDGHLIMLCSEERKDGKEKIWVELNDIEIAEYLESVKEAAQ